MNPSRSWLSRWMLVCLMVVVVVDYSPQAHMVVTHPEAQEASHGSQVVSRGQGGLWHRFTCSTTIVHFRTNSVLTVPQFIGYYDLLSWASNRVGLGLPAGKLTNCLFKRRGITVYDQPY